MWEGTLPQSLIRVSIIPTIFNFFLLVYVLALYLIEITISFSIGRMFYVDFFLPSSYLRLGRILMKLRYSASYK